MAGVLTPWVGDGRAVKSATKVIILVYFNSAAISHLPCTVHLPIRCKEPSSYSLVEVGYNLVDVVVRETACSAWYILVMPLPPLLPL